MIAGRVYVKRDNSAAFHFSASNPLWPHQVSKMFISRRMDRNNLHACARQGQLHQTAVGGMAQYSNHRGGRCTLEQRWIGRWTEMPFGQWTEEVGYRSRIDELLQWTPVKDFCNCAWVDFAGYSSKQQSPGLSMNICAMRALQNMKWKCGWIFNKCRLLWYNSTIHCCAIISKQARFWTDQTCYMDSSNVCYSRSVLTCHFVKFQYSFANVWRCHICWSNFDKLVYCNHRAFLFLRRLVKVFSFPRRVMQLVHRLYSVLKSLFEQLMRWMSELDFFSWFPVPNTLLCLCR